MRCLLLSLLLAAPQDEKTVKIQVAPQDSPVHYQAQLLGELDLRPATFAALRLLEEPRTMSQLADLLHCDNSNVTGIVDNLEDRDLAIRYPSEVDRRIKVVELTVKGEILMRRVRRELAKPPEWVKDLSADDQAALCGILQRAADARNA